MADFVGAQRGDDLRVAQVGQENYATVCGRHGARSRGTAAPLIELVLATVMRDQTAVIGMDVLRRRHLRPGARPNIEAAAQKQGR